MPQSRDPRTGKFAPGGGAGDQPRGGRGWKTAGAKKTKKAKKNGRGAKAKKAVKKRAQQANKTAGDKGVKVAGKIVRKLVKKADQEIKNDPFLGGRRR